MCCIVLKCLYICVRKGMKKIKATRKTGFRNCNRLSFLSNKV
jgi:hypothetical protein